MKKNKKFCEGSRPPWGKTPEGSPPPCLLQCYDKQVFTTCSMSVYIHKWTRLQRPCQNAKSVFICVFLLSHPYPNFRPSNPTFQPSIHPIREQKQIISRAVLIVPRAFPCIQQPIRPHLRHYRTSHPCRSKTHALTFFIRQSCCLYMQIVSLSS